MNPEHSQERISALYYDLFHPVFACCVLGRLAGHRVLQCRQDVPLPVMADSDLTICLLSRCVPLPPTNVSPLTIHSANHRVMGRLVVICRLFGWLLAISEHSRILDDRMERYFCQSIKTASSLHSVLSLTLDTLPQ